jgi:hypothetical protein
MHGLQSAAGIVDMKPNNARMHIAGPGYAREERQYQFRRRTSTPESAPTSALNFSRSEPFE